MSALYIGALIEEADIEDIARAMEDTENPDITTSMDFME